MTIHNPCTDDGANINVAIEPLKSEIENTSFIPSPF